jgi:predicted flap endonuclease-1-like 5' DNA nuclease
VIAVLNLILAFLSIIGQSSFSAMLPAILINAIILIYCLTPGVEKAFQPVSQPTPAVATSTAARAPEPVTPTAAPAPASVAPAMAVEEKMAPIPIEPEAAPVSEPPTEEKAVEVLAPAPVAPPNVPIDTIEGIGSVYSAKLKEIGIHYVADLLAAGASRTGREDLVEKTGISATLILKWVNMADLMRISGVGEEFSELLEAAGVDTVKELRNRNPENLYQAMLQANQQRQMVRRTPHLSEVQSWVEQAKQLEPVMTY